MDGRPWSDLPADNLREISSRLCAPAEFVYFHLVCKPWRASHDQLCRTQFLPWLLAPPADKDPRFRCIFSKSSYHVMPSPTVAARNWVSCADGTAIRYLTVEHLRPTLHDPLTGELTHLPVFPDDVFARGLKENPRGVIYGDGTIFLYNISCVGDNGRTARFRAALLRPCSDVWTVLERTLRAPNYGEFSAAYHGGKIMLTVEATLWRIVTPEQGGDHASDVLVRMLPLPWWERGHYPHEYSYVLESRGKLLWVSLKIYPHYTREHKIWMAVHELRKQGNGKKKTRWVKRDTCILADRVLFLGTPNSFAVDASRFSGRHGGCAFFVYQDNKALPFEKFGVFSYNLVSKKVNFFERLPRGWADERCTWHVIQPTIAPIQELMKAREVMGPTLDIHIKRHYEPSFNVIVRGLPLTLKSSQLQLFLSQHGKVSKAEVLYYKKTNRSQGTALVTMSTLHANHEDARDALNTLSLDGCNLDVRFVKEWRQPYSWKRPCSTGKL